MATEIVVEQLSEQMEFAVVGRWYSEQGARVSKGQPVVELEIEKVTYDVEAPANGVLSKILAVSGDEVAVGAPLGLIEDD